MSFEIKNTPGTFQQPVDVVIAPVTWQTALIYPDDSLVFSQTPMKHIAYVKQILTLLMKEEVTF